MSDRRSGWETFDVIFGYACRLLLVAGCAFLSIACFLRGEVGRGVEFAVLTVLAVGLVGLHIARRRGRLPQPSVPYERRAQAAMRTRSIWLMVIMDVLFIALGAFAVVQIIRGDRVGGAVVILIPGVLGLIFAGRGTAKAFAYKPGDQLPSGAGRSGGRQEAS